MIGAQTTQVLLSLTIFRALIVWAEFHNTVHSGCKTDRRAARAEWPSVVFERRPEELGLCYQAPVLPLWLSSLLSLQYTVHGLYAGASKSLSIALTVGGVACDVIYEWLTVQGPLKPRALTLNGVYLVTDNVLCNQHDN